MTLRVVVLCIFENLDLPMYPLCIAVQSERKPSHTPKNFDVMSPSLPTNLFLQTILMNLKPD